MALRLSFFLATLIHLSWGDDEHDSHDHHHHEDEINGEVDHAMDDHHDEAHSAPQLAIGLFTIGIVVVTLLPVLFPLQKYFSEKRIGYIRCFSGGVFLSMGLYHMMQHAIMEFRHVDLGNFNDGLPLILAMVGYFIILFIERVLFADHDNDDLENPPPTQVIFTPMSPGDVESPITRKQCNDKSSTTYVIMIALSIHAVFEGIALGVQQDVPGVASLAIGILAHKWAESLSLSVSLQNQGTEKKQRLAMLLIFTLVTPLGVGIGLCINQWTSSIVTATTQALSAGTFIYISCSERFVSEFNCPLRERCLKFLAALIGAATIVGVASIHTH